MAAWEGFEFLFGEVKIDHQLLVIPAAFPPWMEFKRVINDDGTVSWAMENQLQTSDGGKQDDEDDPRHDEQDDPRIRVLVVAEHVAADPGDDGEKYRRNQIAKPNDIGQFEAVLAEIFPAAKHDASDVDNSRGDKADGLHLNRAILEAKCQKSTPDEAQRNKHDGRRDRGDGQGESVAGIGDGLRNLQIPDRANDKRHNEEPQRNA